MKLELKRGSATELIAHVRHGTVRINIARDSQSTTVKQSGRNKSSGSFAKVYNTMSAEVVEITASRPPRPALLSQALISDPGTSFSCCKHCDFAAQLAISILSVLDSSNL